jgi:hypothetical protein
MQVTLVWDANTESDLAGYLVYHGISPGVYDPGITVLAPTTTYTFTNLPFQVTNYFAVKAFDTTGNVSTSYSNEVTHKEEFPIFLFGALTNRPNDLTRLRWDTDVSNQNAGFISEALGLNAPVIPPPPDSFPLDVVIGGFQFVG